MGEVREADPLDPEDVLIGILNIFFNLFNKEGRRFKTDFISNSLFEMDLNFLPINILIEIQNMNLQ